MGLVGDVYIVTIIHPFFLLTHAILLAFVLA